MRGRPSRLVLCFGIVFTVFFSLLLLSSAPNSLNSSEAEIEVEEYSEKDFVKLVVSTYGKSRLLEQFCLTHDYCFDIKDEAVSEKNRTYFMRLARRYNSILTMAALKFPKRLSRQYVDTSKWEIDFNKATGGVAEAMINELYSCGVLPKDEKSNADVLSLGLGGGFLNGFLHHTFPYMSITVVEINDRAIKMAGKWFNLETNERHRVILMDGIKYIEESAEKDRRFDIIFIDACLDREDLICPTSEFLRNDVIKNIAQLLGERGVLIIDVLPRRSPEKMLERITSAFEKHFNYGKLIHFRGTRNYILTLSKFKYFGLRNTTRHHVDE